MRAEASTQRQFLSRIAPRFVAALLCGALSLLAAASSAPAQETATNTDAAATDSGPVELAPLVIEDEKPAEQALVERSFETPDDVAGFGETIYAEPIWRGFETPAELLGQSVGAQVRRQGGRDDFATLTIRGAPSGQLRILLDGIALGRASDNVVNLSDLPFDSIERIEIYRGFAPVSLTPTSAAGVVNLITRESTEPSGSFAVGGGSFGTAKANASASGPFAGGDASAFAAYRHTDGDFEYIDDNGTLNNPFDDRRRKRANNDSDTVESLLRWRRPVSDSTQLQLRNHLFRKEEGVSNFARFAPPDGRLETVREIAAASFGSRDRRWSLEQSVTWESEELRDAPPIDNTAETTATSTVGRWTRPFGKSHWLSASGDYTWEDFSQRGDSIDDQDADRSSLAVGIGDDWTIDAIDTTLSFQLRHQQLWNGGASAGADGGSEHSTDPRVGLRWQAFGGFAVKANVSSYFRPPSFDELYGTDGFTVGNPDLRSETGIAFDAGFEWNVEREPFGKLALGYAWFGSEIDDIIIIRLNFRRLAMAENVDEARIRGHELRAEWKGLHGLALSANYTYQDAESRSPSLRGFQLAGVAPHELYARLSWTWKQFVLAYDITVTSEHYIDSENSYELPTRTEHGLALIYGPFWKGLRLSFEAENLGDTLVPDPLGYPLPGRSFFATLSWSSGASDES